MPMFRSSRPSLAPSTWLCGEKKVMMQNPKGKHWTVLRGIGKIPFGQLFSPDLKKPSSFPSLEDPPLENRTIFAAL